MFFLLYASGPSDERRRAQDSAGILGLAIFIVSVTFALSYVYPVPLLYHTQIIPIAFTSAIAAILMGAGLISAAGPRALPLTYITGPSTRARLLRAFLPLTVIIILVQSFLMVSVTADFIIHDVILLAVSVVIFSLVTLVVVAKVSGGVSADIDRLQQEFKKADEALHESERRLADIIGFLPDATFVIDTNGTVIAWNHAIEEMTGVPAEQMIGKANYEYALPFYHERRPITIDRVLNDDPGSCCKISGHEKGG